MHENPASRMQSGGCMGSQSSLGADSGIPGGIHSNSWPTHIDQERPIVFHVRSRPHVPIEPGLMFQSNPVPCSNISVSHVPLFGASHVHHRIALHVQHSESSRGRFYSGQESTAPYPWGSRAIPCTSWADLAASIGADTPSHRASSLDREGPWPLSWPPARHGAGHLNLGKQCRKKASARGPPS